MSPTETPLTPAPFLRRIILLVMIPFACFLFFAYRSILTAMMQNRSAEQVLRQAEHLEHTHRLITKLQRERSRSALVLTGAIPPDDLEKLYKETEAILQTFLETSQESQLPPHLRRDLDTLAGQITKNREDSRRRETFQQSYLGYTRLIDFLHDVQKSTAQAFQDVETARLFNNILLIEAAREHAGKLRVNFTRLLTPQAEFKDEEHYLLLQTHSAVSELLNVRALSLSREAQQLLSQSDRSPEWRYVNKMISRMFKEKLDLRLLNTSPTTFVQAITKVIDDLENITTIENRRIRERQATIRERAHVSYYTVILLITLVTLFLAYFGYDYVQGVIDRNMVSNQLRETLYELSEARKQEISIGWQIQQDLLLGKAPPNLMGARIASRTAPSLGIDGDFIDFFPLDQKTVDILFGDVMGKGIPAALVGAATKSHFQRAMSQLLLTHRAVTWPDTVAVVKSVHERMAAALLAVERFVSLHYARFRLESQVLELVNCGHTEVLRFSRRDGSSSFHEPQNAPLGIFEEETFEVQTIPFSSGDVFVFYSDGITEARNPSGEFFGKDRIVQIVATTRDGEVPLPEAIVQRVFHELYAFAGTDTFRDDLTILVIEIA